MAGYAGTKNKERRLDAAVFSGFESSVLVTTETKKDASASFFICC